MELLERGPLLGQLGDILLDTTHGRGRLVLVAGEAGIGKTALVEGFCLERRDAVEVLWGSCDYVVPQRSFAPVADIAHHVGGTLRNALDAADRNQVFESFLTILRQRARLPRVVVFDDLQWADDATLDLLRVVGRRLRELSVLLIGTYRDEEVGGEHPLRLALGDVPGAVVVELSVPPLSVAAVRALAEGTRTDPDELHAVTAGNPFFVTEVLSAGGDDVPATVRDAVLARVARLSAPARRVLGAASVLGQRFEPGLLREVAECSAAPIEECLARGMLQLDGDALQFRHELAQRAVRSALTPSERADAHGRALSALRRIPAADPAQLAHHAVAAGDVQAVVELAPAAGDHAAALGGHREAAAHYLAALNVADELDERSRAELLERHARERLLIDDVEQAIASQEEALEIWHGLQDSLREGDGIRALSLMVWFAGEGDRAIELAQNAVTLLESVPPPGPELARAYAALAQRHFTAGHGLAAVVPWGERALELAERLGYEQVAVHALTTIGAIEIYAGNDGGWARLEESLARARAAGLDDDIARALINLVEVARDTRRYDLVDRYRGEASAYMSERDHDLDLYRRRLASDLAEVALERGRWEEAETLAGDLIRGGRTAPLIRAKALTVLGRCRARRGRGEPWPALDEAIDLLVPRGEWQDISPLRAARAEAAWLEGNDGLAGDEAMAGLALEEEDGDIDPWFHGELGYWAWKTGRLEHRPTDAARPYVLLSSGRHREAAAAWKAIGCSYHQALALADGDAEEDLRQALRLFQALEAGPMVTRVVKRLQEIGARGIPRGPRPSARRNPAGLTARELEVLALLGKRLRNVDIAERLSLSPKTVDHHVSAILRKLGVPNRAAAVEAAARLGLEDGEVVTAE